MTKSRTNESIAIIGIGCRFPGGVTSSSSFWDFLVRGGNGIREVPLDCWNLDHFYDGTPGKFNRINNKYGGFLLNIDKFDAKFFGISDREAKWMDPQQRLLLEVSWEAIEDSGLLPSRLSGKNVGVFIGIAGHDYSDLQQKGTAVDVYTNTGSANSIAANRIAYFFNWIGPCLSVDTACSSSLVALHLACQSINNNECALALVAGCNLLLNPNISCGFSRANFLSPDGCCRAFDDEASGYVRSEGVGVVVLEPQSKAQDNGRDIYALIRGTGTNNDGKTNGITLPSCQSQAKLLRDVYKKAGVSPSDVTYIEAHGTGTPVGDPIELSAIADAIGKQRVGTPLVIGSVKSNIGHLETASGIAGLIKLALCIKNKKIPRTLHFKHPNSNVDFAKLNLRVSTELEDWIPDSDKLIGGVNSFGFGGSNAHAILESTLCSPTNQILPPVENKVLRPIPISAKSEPALKAYVSKLRSFLKDEVIAQQYSLYDIGYNLSLRRDYHDVRMVFLSRTLKEFGEDLEAFAKGNIPETVCLPQTCLSKSIQTVFAFAGQGPQWWAMARQLIDQEPVVSEIIKRCDRILRQHVDWSLWDELHATEEESRINQTDIAQPAIFAVQIALAALWESFGITADAVVGHSVGEVAAAYVAGIYSLEDALTIILHRSRLQHRTLGQGKMVAISLPAEEIEGIIQEYDKVCMASVNSPSAVTLSGDEDQLRHISKVLKQQAIFYKFLRFDYAFHCHYMEPLKQELLESLGNIAPRASKIPMFSTVTGRLERGESFDATYWCRNIREPVLFKDAIYNILQQEQDQELVFVEISNHPVLSGYISQCMDRSNRKGHVICSIKRKENEHQTILKSLGQLFCIGKPINWKSFYPNGKQCRIPTYAWDHKSFWHEPIASHRFRLKSRKHPYLDSEVGSTHPTWQMDFNTQSFPYLGDHRIQGNVVYPGAGYIELALAVYGQNMEEGPCELENVRFRKAFSVPSSDIASFQIVHFLESSEFQIFSCGKNAEDDSVLHCEGYISKLQQNLRFFKKQFEDLKAAFFKGVKHINIYESFTNVGLEYGEFFQGIQSLWRRPGEALAEVRIPKISEEQLNRYRFHPCYLDSCFQVLFGATSLEEDQNYQSTYLPVKIERIRYFAPPCDNIWVHAKLTKQTTQRIEGNIVIYDNSGLLLLEISGFCCKSLGKMAARDTRKYKEWFYQFEWIEESVTINKQGISNLLVLKDNMGIGDTILSKFSCEGNKALSVAMGEVFERSNGHTLTVNPSEPSHWESFFNIICSEDIPIDNVIFLWGLDAPLSHQTTINSLHKFQTNIIGGLLDLLRVLSEKRPKNIPRIWIITQGAEKVLPTDYIESIVQSSLWGLGRVVRNEIPSCHCTLVDIDPLDSLSCIPLILKELATNHKEMEVSFRGNKRFVNRFVSIPSDKIIPELEQQKIHVSSKPIKLQSSTPGTLESLSLCEVEESPLSSGDVRIQVRAAGLNFRDLLKVMGIYPTEDEEDYQLGDECSGIVVSAGTKVNSVKKGDAVIAVSPGCLGSYIIASAKHIMKKPEYMTFEEAANIPIAFLTAYYSIIKLARLKKGEKILIHAASGGVGQAAVQLAHMKGAQILATAGTPQKRNYLKTLGIEYVMDSRSLDFANEVLHVTNREGVDVILNSIPGHALLKNLGILKPYGRFLELGKRDIFQNNKIGLWSLRRNISFFAIDLADIFKNRTEFLRTLLRQLYKFFQQEKLRPLPHKDFHISEYKNAFQYLAQTKHIGKLVITFSDENKASVTMLPQTRKVAVSDSTYLITGGYSGFGFELAKWLVKNGARHLVLLGRTGKPSIDISRQIKELRKDNIHIEIVAGDVARADVVKSVIERIRTSMPRLKGVIHAAMVLDDDFVVRLTRDRFEKVMAPKVLGAWNLHMETLEEKLDFFVLCSSVASLIGNPGQGSYAAANSFLDMMSHYRRSLGLPCLVVNWGVFSMIGYVSRHKDVGRLLQSYGLKGIHPAQALEILGRLLTRGVPEIGVIRCDWNKLIGSSLPFVCSSVFSSMIKSATNYNCTRSKTFISKILSMEESERLDAIVEQLQQQIVDVLGMDESHLDCNKSLNSLGVESLMAVELSNKISHELGIELTMMDFVQGPTIKELSNKILNMITNNPHTNVGGIEESSKSFQEPIHKDAVDQETVSDEYSEPISLGPSNVSCCQSDIYKPFPLSPLQSAYWIGRSDLLPGSDVGCHAYMESEAKLDVSNLEMVVNRLIERHDMLRAVILPDGLQQIQKSVPYYVIDKQDLSCLSNDERELQLRNIRENMSHRKYDPQKWPLFTLAATRIDRNITRLHFSFDLLIGDVTSLQILIYEMTILYNKPDLVLPKHNSSFKDYIIEKEHIKSLPIYRNSKKYWLERLDELPMRPELPLQNNPTEVKKTKFSRRSFSLEKEPWKLLKNKASNIGVTPSSLLLAIYAEVLSFFSKSHHFCITVTLSNRIPFPSNGKAENDYSLLVGDFSTTLMVEINNTYKESFEEKVRRHHDQLWRDHKHRHFSGIEVLRELARRRKLNIIPTIPVVFTCVLGQARPLLDDRINPILTKQIYTISQTPQVWIDFQALEVEGKLLCSWDAVDELFSIGLLDDMFESFSSLLLNLYEASIAK